MHGTYDPMALEQSMKGAWRERDVGKANEGKEGRWEDVVVPCVESGWGGDFENEVDCGLDDR